MVEKEESRIIVNDVSLSPVSHSLAHCILGNFLAFLSSSDFFFQNNFF